MKKDVQQWITVHPGGDKNAKGQPIPVGPGETKKEAIDSFFDSMKRDNGVDYIEEYPDDEVIFGPDTDNFDSTESDNGVDKKERKYGTYYIYNDDDDSLFRSATGVSKQEYDKAIKEGKEGYFEKIENTNIPKDIEERMKNALSDINAITNYENFEAQIKNKIWGNGIYYGNYEQILNGFDDDINNRYNELIKPQIDKINNVKISDFSNFLNSTKLKDNEKILIEKSFNDCENEDYKTMAAIVYSSLNTEITINKNKAAFSDKKIKTCYLPLENRINFENENNVDSDVFYHETFHSVFDKYKIKKSGLVEIIKEESKQAKEMINQEFDFRKHIPKEKLKEYQTNKEKLKKLTQELNKLKEGNSTYKLFYSKLKGLDLSVALTRNPSMKEFREEFYRIKHEMFYPESSVESLENEAKYKLNLEIYKYGNLRDMAEAIGAEIGFGHGKKYWKEDEINQTHEFFAEMSSIKATGNKNNEYELIKKFFPKSVQKYEEIIKDIFKNKGKVFER